MQISTKISTQIVLSQDELKQAAIEFVKANTEVPADATFDQRDPLLRDALVPRRQRVHGRGFGGGTACAESTDDDEGSDRDAQQPAHATATVLSPPPEPSPPAET